MVTLQLKQKEFIIELNINCNLFIKYFNIYLNHHQNNIIDYKDPVYFNIRFRKNKMNYYKLAELTRQLVSLVKMVNQKSII